MNLVELHQIPKFSELFEDWRFKALIIHLQANPGPRTHIGAADSTTLVNNEGCWKGWFACLDAMKSASNPPAGDPDRKKVAPYSGAPRT